MAQFNDTGYISQTAAAAISIYERVAANGTVAGATAQDIGVACQTVASGEQVTLSAANKQGTQKAIASGVIVTGARVYTAASGKISATQATGAFLRGIAIDTAAADGDVIEILPVVGDVAGS